jgi:hypothetical protein
MYHDRRSPSAQEIVGGSGAERQVRVDGAERCAPIRARHQIREIATMRPRGVLHTMVRGAGVEMPARRGEIRWVTTASLMDMETMAPSGEPRDLDLDPDAMLGIRQHGPSNRTAIPVPQLGVRGVGS